MDRYIKKRTAIAHIIGIIAILLMLGVWPFGVIHRSYKTTSEIPEAETAVVRSEPASEDHMLAQVFVSEGTRLESVDVFVCNDVAGKRVDFAVYDGAYNRLYHRLYVLDEDTALPGYIHIPVGLDTDRGVPYIYTIFGAGLYGYEQEGDYDPVPMVVGYEDHYATKNTSVYPVNYDGTENEQYNIICSLKYSIRFNIWQTIFIDLGICLVAAILIYLIHGKLADAEIAVRSIIKTVCNPLIIIFSLVVLYNIYPRCFWGDKTYNIIFSYIGVIMAATGLLYYVNRRGSYTSNETFARIETRIRPLLTSVAIAITLWHCFEYMNGLFDIVHYMEARRILIWFLIVLITTYNKRELLNIPNAVWLVTAIPISLFYAKQYVGIGEDEILYRLNAWIIYFGGFVIINMVMTVIALVKKKMRVARIWIPYAIPFAVFIIGTLALAHTRWWPTYLAVMMVLLGFRLAVWEDLSDWPKLLTDGVILNFLAMVVFSLHHRPYHAYIYHRYNMTYYTVTMTATHLSMSLAAAAVRLFIRYREIKSAIGSGRTAMAGDSPDTGSHSSGSAAPVIRHLLPELALFGMVSCYIIMTLSRTAYAAVILMIAAGLIITIFTYYSGSKRLTECLKYLAAMIISTVLMFPIVFSATRMIPAVFDDPVIYAYEPASGTIYKGTPASDDKYMDIHRFFEVFGSKVLSIGDTVTDAGDFCPKPVQICSAGGTDAGSLWDTSEPEYTDPDENDVTNGRMSIFRSYIEQSNLWGHDTMGAILEDGTESAHAHNIYLQVVFDHGWIFGIYFVLFLIYSWVISVVRLYRSKNTSYESATTEDIDRKNDCSVEAGRAGKEVRAGMYRLFIPILLAGFMTAGMAEWIFHPCNPFGLAVCMGLVSMVFRDK